MRITQSITKHNQNSLPDNLLFMVFLVKLDLSHTVLSDFKLPQTVPASMFDVQDT